MEFNKKGSGKFVPFYIQRFKNYIKCSCPSAKTDYEIDNDVKEILGDLK